ncbi:maleylpyruvate isomerase family mycothiol-dependent enzyme [Streptomyces sp. LX-29]|uniref:maleylpyruvate isomerase family mycothiol-dependent enzyme n=1 Tax=Streptomyces sp. LX-29 TaxID=2900152 RepID=UPI00240E3BE4|nr:maleylpyruvate isomerase family mycothiol-dependent enzyme [Streptomyces sp. LX-29]WFB10119.1 maleylpyruvate isomerase family mycothiol-dependent enzyme [Streptomyces sp. LX-29]
MSDYADYARDASAVQGATDRLLSAVATLEDTAVAEPSSLPGWTRGHLLAHLARNADALTNLLVSARTGEKIPMYASEEARDADIERDASRPLAVHLDDLRTSAFRFNAAAAALPRDRWSAEVAMRRGVVEQAARLPFRRLVEVELHHVDLDLGYTLADLPAGFVTQELDFLTTVKFAGHPDVPPLRLAATGDGPVRDTGRADGPRLTVTGSPADLLGWLTGRGDGAALSCPAPVLPALPPLG